MPHNVGGITEQIIVSVDKEKNMNQEVKVKWVSALRSGKFKQGKGQLKSSEGHCCLGVLCELALEEGVENSSFDDSAWFPNSSVVKWAGLDSENPKIQNENENDKCGISAFNDGVLGIRKHSFEEIADLIEKYL